MLGVSACMDVEESSRETGGRTEGVGALVVGGAGFTMFDWNRGCSAVAACSSNCCRI